METAIPSWSVCGDRQKQWLSPSKGWDADKILGIRSVPWSLDGSDKAFDVQVGMERPAEMMPRAPGDVLMENKVARTCFRRADFE